MNEALSPAADVEEVEPQRGSNPPSSSFRSIRLHRSDYVVIGLVVAVVRTTFSWGRTSFTLAPDEIAIGGMARHLSGTDSWNMFIASTWRPGLSTLLAPIFWFTSDPELFVRIALVVNAAIAGIAAVWLARLAQRLTELGRFALVAAVVIISLMPASLSASSFVWAEPLITLAFLAGTWGVLRCQDDPRLSTAGMAILWSLIGSTAHGRMLPFVVLVTGAVCLPLLRGHRWREAAAAAGAAGIGLLLSYWYADYVFDAVWEVRAEENSAGTVLAKLGDPLAIVDSATGQLWYLLATTATMFGIGVFALVRAAAFRKSRLPTTADARAILFVTIPMVAVSIVFTSDRGRSDFFVYGRYNDAIIGPILVVAVAWLVIESRTMTPRAWWWLVGCTSALTLELGLVTNQLHGDRLAATSLLPMIAGVQPLAGATWGVDVLRVTVVSLLVAAVILALSRWGAHRDRALLAAASIVAIFAGVQSHRVFDHLPTVRDSVVTEVEGRFLEPHQSIFVEFTPERFAPEASFSEQRTRVLQYQWYLPGHEFEPLRAEDPAAGTVVFATPEDPTLESLGAVELWRNPAGTMALWRLGEPTSDP